MGWIVRVAAQTQGEAVAAITRAGGQVTYEWGWCDPKLAAQPPWQPNWLVDAIGIDYFAHPLAYCSGLTAPIKSLPYSALPPMLVSAVLLARKSQIPVCGSEGPPLSFDSSRSIKLRFPTPGSRI